MADLAHLQAVAKRKIPRSVDTLIAALRERRHALGLTQADIARAIGYSLSAIETWEEGRAQPKTTAILAYAAVVEARIELVPLTPPPLQIT
ncbi:MAG: helix-turn-helix transcriptional regulator, partial [Micromonosporaceae bacterium]